MAARRCCTAIEVAPAESAVKNGTCSEGIGNSSTPEHRPSLSASVPGGRSAAD